MMFLKRLISLFALLFLLFSIGWIPASAPVFAQSRANRWDTPQNISKAGESLNPILGADANGDLHVFWADLRSGVYYAYTTPEGWSTPKKASFPIPREVMNSTLAFQHANPRLVRSIGTRMYLFWKDENFLVFNIGNVGSAEKLTSWMPTRLIARFVTHYDVQVDSDGIIHLAYLQTEDYANNPAGIYYTRSLDFGGTWSLPILILPSIYFRSLLPVIQAGIEPPQPIMNSLDLSIAQHGEQKIIYLAFDQQPRKKVWIAQSDNGGQDWNAPIEIDAASSSGGISSPENIHVASMQEHAVLVWQVRQSETVCFTYFKQSDDAGKTWSASQRLNTPFLTCSDHIEFLENPDNLPLLSFYTQKLLYFTTWDGRNWSEIFNEPYALSFMDPETSNGVSLNLFNLTSIHPGKIALTGVDINANHDIWVRSANVEDISSWLPQNPGWKPSQIIQTTDNSISDLQIIEDQQKHWHAFWLQDEILELPPGTLVRPQPQRIAYYAFLDGTRWSFPIAMFKPLASSDASQRIEEQIARLKVTVDAENRFLALWQNQIGGEVFFSWSKGKESLSALDWSPPTLVYPIPNAATDFSIKTSPEHSIKVAYTIPINENRGVYIIESKDSGKTWTKPVPVINGVSLGWETVSKPVLTFTTDGGLHLSAINQSLREGNPDKGLYETHSYDQGNSWTTPEKVSSNLILWNTLLAYGNTLHRIWAEREPGDNRAVLLHQTSQDSGRTWGKVTRITEWNDPSVAVQATTDEAGQVHLVVLSTQPLGNDTLRYMVWTLAGWDEMDTLDFGVIGKTSQEIPLDIKVRKDGFAGFLIGLNLYNPQQNRDVMTLLGSDRTVEIPPVPVLPTSIPETPVLPSPTPTSTPSPTKVSEPTFTPHLQSTTAPPAMSISTPFSSSSLFLIGGVFSGLVFLTVLGFVGFRYLKKKRSFYH